MRWRSHLEQDVPTPTRILGGHNDDLSREVTLSVPLTSYTFSINVSVASGQVKMSLYFQTNNGTSRNGTGQVCPRVAISARGFLLNGKDTGSGGCNESISLCRDTAPGKKPGRTACGRPAVLLRALDSSMVERRSLWRALTPAATLLIYWRGTAEVPRGEGAVAGQVSSHQSIRAD